MRAGERHPGLIVTGLPVLRAPAGELPGLRARAVAADIGVIAFPSRASTTTDYDAFCATVAETAEPDYLGLAFYGPATSACAASPAASAPLAPTCTARVGIS